MNHLLRVYFGISLLLVLCAAASESKQVSEGRKATIQELEEEANAVLSRSNVSARRDIDVVFELADRLLLVKETDSAEKYLYKGLQHNPWNLEHQIIYADLLAKKGKKDAATEKASLVLKHAETQLLIDQAKELLNIPPQPNFPEIHALSGTSHSVVLVPLQKCEKWLISKLQADIAQTLGIPVYIQRIETNYPKPSRDLRGQIINQIRRQIESEGMKDQLVIRSMKQLNLKAEDLRDDENLVNLFEYLLTANGTAAVEQFRSSLKEAEGQKPQWSANSLQSVLFESVAPYRRENVAYLGVTSEDIYEKDYNFLFGWANPKGGVMSYRRFTAQFNGEVPSQDRLAKRAKMQALSSIGHTFGIKRCTHPTCARAYSHSLSEHDSKEGALCPQCESEFKKLFEQDSGGNG